MQKPMKQMLLALSPLVLASIYFFGWRTLLIFGVVNIVGFLAEYLFARMYGKQVSLAVFITNFIFALSLPPTIPLYIAAVGIAFGVIFGKMVFGGFGKNIFNPAISGRAFIYISFGYDLTSRFVPPVTGFPGGFSFWLPNVDAVTKATPLVALKNGEVMSRLDLLFGNTAGSMGETFALLIIIAGLYLVIKKTANWRIITGSLGGYAVLQILFWLLGVSGACDPVTGMLAGSLLFGVFFCATDPVSASQTTNSGRWIYGIFIGFMIALIRQFSIWPEAVTFAILLANMFAPLLDYLLKEQKKRKKERAKV